MKLMGIDPSGSGVTGISIVIKDDKEDIDEELKFFDYKNSQWKEHYYFIKNIIEKEEIEIIIFENTNYIHKKTKDGLSLFRLLGATEFISNSKKIFSINVLKVKKLRKKILRKEFNIEEISYFSGRGKGWFFKNEKISTHCLDSYLVYFIWKKEEIENNLKKNKKIKQ